MKKRPQTPLAYAQFLYMAAHCNGSVSAMTDTDIISARVRAFVDGVNWQKRQAAKKRRANNGSAKHAFTGDGGEPCVRCGKDYRDAEHFP